MLKYRPSLGSLIASHDGDETASPARVSIGGSSHKTPSSTRKIAKKPFKTLDAPFLRDDYYLNLVDWSPNNVLAVALGNSVFMWSAYTSKVLAFLIK